MGFGAGAGIKTFLGLEDTPSTFVNQARKLTRVNVAENALELAGISMMQYDLWDTYVALWHADLLENFTEFVTGSGTTSYAMRKLTVQTGVDAGSLARLSTAVEIGQLSAPINWGKALWLQAVVQFDTSGGISTKYALFTINEAAVATQNIVDKGFAIQYARQGLALEGQSHDGVARSVVALGAMPMAGGSYEWTVIRIAFYPGSRVEFWVMDGDVMVKKGEITTNLPTGTDVGTSIQFLAYNASTANNQIARLSDLRIAKGFG